MIFAVTLTYQAYENEQASVATQLLGTARAIAGVVDGEIDEADAFLKTIAATPALRSDQLTFVEDIGRHALTDPSRWFVARDADGRQLINTHDAPGKTSVRQRRLDPNLVAAAAATNGRYVTDLELSAGATVPTIHVDRPVLRNGQLKYVISVGITPQSLGREINVSRLAPGCIVVVTDRKGLIVARSLNDDRFVGRSITDEMLGQMHRREGIVTTVSLENIPVLTAFTQAQCGWSIFIAAPRAELYTSARKLLAWAVAGSALLTAIAILMAGWILRALLRSVDSLSEDAATLGQGQMPQLKPSGLTETDFVAAAMRRTAELLLRRTQVLEQVNHDNLELQSALSRELEAKSRSEAELERKVEERTASLREAVSQMEEFSYTVSHDLRSPLRAMQGYAQILLEEYQQRLDETGQDYLRRIQRAAERMDRLTTDVLNYTRVARAEFTLVPTDLDTIVRNAVAHYDELQRFSASVRIESPLLPVWAHEPSLMQCVSNLLTNAVKFVKPGEAPRITVRTERAGARVRLWVEDHGIGIAPENQGALFRMFERLPTGGKYEGTGVGLAIVRKGAEKMGGSCGVVSDGVNGSRFWIELAAAE